MELWNIVEQATTPLGFDPYAVAMGARNNALNQEQQRTQNAVSALNLGREQALQGIAPQIGQAFADSGMPMGSILGQMVSADPRLASMGFREAMDFEQQKIRNQQLQVLAKPEVQEVLKNVRDDILTLQQIERDVTNGLNRDKVVEQASLYQTALNELTFAKQELAKYGANASMIDQNIPKFTPYMTLFKDILTAQQQVEAGNRAQTQLQMNQEMHPIEKDYKQAQTRLANAQAGRIPQEEQNKAQDAKAQLARDNATAIKDASDAIIALNKLKTLKVLADQGNLSAKQAIVFLNARGVSGPGVLTESDISNTSGTTMLQDLAQKVRLKDEGQASAYSTIYPSAEKLFRAEIDSRKSQLRSAVDSYNNSRLNPNDRIAVDDLLPKEGLLPLGNSNSSSTGSKTEPSGNGKKFDFSKFKKK
jgi:hypothetical protein